MTVNQSVRGARENGDIAIREMARADANGVVRSFRRRFEKCDTGREVDSIDPSKGGK